MWIRKGLLLICLVAFAGAGCALAKKAASGGDISQRDVVNASDKQIKKEQGEREQIADYVKRIDKTLADISEKRSEGNFSSAEYREKTLDRYLEKLKELDSDHEKLASAPKELVSIKEKYSREVYEKKALTEECQRKVEKAKESRMDEQWRYVERNLDYYVKCRRKLQDVGGEASDIAAQDKLYKGEVKEFANYALEQIETKRKAKNFRTAAAFEQTLERHLEQYDEIDESNSYTKGVAKRMKKVQMTYRDPKEVEAEKAESAFNAWRENAIKAFEKEMTNIRSAEDQARPAYKAGVEALEEGDYDTAQTKLTEARQTLYSNAYSSPVALDTAIANGNLKRGLSYEIAAALARVHFEEGELAKLYPELNIIKDGRSWIDDKDEKTVRLYDILADSKGKLAPKATSLVKRYASRYSDTARTYRFTKEAADAKVGEAYAMLGVDLETISHRKAGASPDDNAGEVIFVEETVDAVKGGKLKFDFRSSYKVPTKCWNTKEVSSVNVYTGRVNYKQKCKYKEVDNGYILSVSAPEGTKVKEGDTVSFYATVGSKTGDHTVNLNEPGYVRVAPEGKTAWYLGVDVE